MLVYRNPIIGCGIEIKVGRQSANSVYNVQQRVSISTFHPIGRNVHEKISACIADRCDSAFWDFVSRPRETEVTLIAPGGARAVLDQLIPEFEKKTGYKVKPTIGSGLGTKKQVVQGEAFDVPIVQPPLDDVIASGNVVVGTQKLSRALPSGSPCARARPNPTSQLLRP